MKMILIYIHEQKITNVCFQRKEVEILKNSCV